MKRFLLATLAGLATFLVLFSAATLSNVYLGYPAPGWGLQFAGVFMVGMSIYAGRIVYRGRRPGWW